MIGFAAIHHTFFMILIQFLYIYCRDDRICTFLYTCAINRCKRTHRKLLSKCCQLVIILRVSYFLLKIKRDQHKN